MRGSQMMCWMESLALHTFDNIDRYSGTRESFNRLRELRKVTDCPTDAKMKQAIEEHEEKLLAGSVASGNAGSVASGNAGDAEDENKVGGGEENIENEKEIVINKM